METWIAIDSQSAVDGLMDAFDGFHDACLREASIAGETYVNEQRGMHCPGHLETSVVMSFQSQGSSNRAIEIFCKGVSLFRIAPTPDGCDSILGAALVSREGALWRFCLSFVGAPLTGRPNTFIDVTYDPRRAPDIEVAAISIFWRVTVSLGSGLRYRPDSLLNGGPLIQ